MTFKYVSTSVTYLPSDGYLLRYSCQALTRRIFTHARTLHGVVTFTYITPRFFFILTKIYEWKTLLGTFTSKCDQQYR